LIFHIEPKSCKDGLRMKRFENIFSFNLKISQLENIVFLMLYLIADIAMLILLSVFGTLHQAGIIGGIFIVIGIAVFNTGYGLIIAGINSILAAGINIFVFPDSNVRVDLVVSYILMYLIIAFGIGQSLASVKKKNVKLETLADMVAEEKEMLKTIIKSIGEAVLIVDVEGNVIDSNALAEDLFEHRRQDMLDININNLMKIENPKHCKDGLEPSDCIQNIREPLIITDDTVLVTPNGKKHIEGSVSPILRENGERLGAVFVISDATHKRIKDEKIKYLSYHDALTGLYNRNSYKVVMNPLHAQSTVPVSVIFIDVNDLKVVNDGFGHNTGDKLLTLAGRIINRSCREGDFVFRWGGDEFVVVVPGADRRTAVDLCKRIGSNCMKTDFETGISLAIGHATKTRPLESLYAAVKKAEAMMYRHKRYVKHIEAVER